MFAYICILLNFSYYKSTTLNSQLSDQSFFSKEVIWLFLVNRSRTGAWGPETCQDFLVLVQCIYKSSCSCIGCVFRGFWVILCWSGSGHLIFLGSSYTFCIWRYKTKHFRASFIHKITLSPVDQLLLSVRCLSRMSTLQRCGQMSSAAEVRGSKWNVLSVFRWMYLMNSWKTRQMLIKINWIKKKSQL